MNKTTLHPDEVFYKDALEKLIETKIPFLIGGTYALNAYTGINRETHDMDIFCKAGDYPLILKFFSKLGFDHEITDDRWLAKLMKDNYFIDIIFSSTNSVTPVNDSWFKRARKCTLYGLDLRLISVEEMIWSKSYRQDKERYDGPDINHLILTQADKIDWKHLLGRFELHWEILLGHLINFRFVYPAERDKVPKWLLQELLSRVSNQLDLTSPKDKVCRGTMLSATQYNIDIKEWGYKDTTY